MSRARLALAVLGILITTGGCADLATAPEAALGGAAPAETRAANPAAADSVADPRGGGSDGDFSTLSTGYIKGGG